MRSPEGPATMASENPSQQSEWLVRRQEVDYGPYVTGEVLSACGTHLGSYLPDAQGDRYCIDLACIAGNAKPV